MYSQGVNQFSGKAIFDQWYEEESFKLQRFQPLSKEQKKLIQSTAVVINNKTKTKQEKEKKNSVKYHVKRIT